MKNRLSVISIIFFFYSCSISMEDKKNDESLSQAKGSTPKYKKEFLFDTRAITNNGNIIREVEYHSKISYIIKYRTRANAKLVMVEISDTEDTTTNIYYISPDFIDSTNYAVIGKFLYDEYITPFKGHKFFNEDSIYYSDKSTALNELKKGFSKTVIGENIHIKEIEAIYMYLKSGDSKKEL